MKGLIGLVIGAAVAVAVIVPVTRSQTAAKLKAQRVQFELAAAQAEIDTLKAAQTAETAEPQVTADATEAAQTATTAEPAEATEIAAEATEQLPAAEIVETVATPEAIASPQVEQAAQTASEYPKYFYIEGQKYAYLTAYYEETGLKTEIFEYAEGESNAVQSGFYDWAADPNGKIPGPFTGNGVVGGN